MGDLPPEAAAKCPPLPRVPLETMGDLANAYAAALDEYAQCQRRHAAAVDGYGYVQSVVNGKVKP